MDQKLEVLISATIFCMSGIVIASIPNLPGILVGMFFALGIGSAVLGMLIVWKT